MTRILIAFAAAALFALPATVLACAMEFEIPEELEQPDPDQAALVALMEEIDGALEESEPAPMAEADSKNATKRAETDAVAAAPAPAAIAPKAS